VIAGEQFSLEPFYGAVNAGVSANLCKALADLGGEDKDQRFEIGFGWARGLSTKNVPGEVVFSEATPQILAQAGDELTAMARAGTAHITGRVKDLQEQPGGRHRVQVRGVLRMEHGANLRRRSVWVVVNGEQHEVAIEAYRARQNVEIAGRLSTDRGSLELLAATLHRVL
jgi:hypothetical protein